MLKFSIKIPRVDFAYDLSQNFIMGIAAVDPKAKEKDGSLNISDFFGANKWKMFDPESRLFSYQLQKCELKNGQFIQTTYKKEQFLKELPKADDGAQQALMQQSGITKYR